MRFQPVERLQARVRAGAGEGETEVDLGGVGARHAAGDSCCSGNALIHPWHPVSGEIFGGCLARTDHRDPDRILGQPERLAAAPDLEAGGVGPLAGVLDEHEATCGGRAGRVLVGSGRGLIVRAGLSRRSGEGGVRSAGREGASRSSRAAASSRLNGMAVRLDDMVHLLGCCRITSQSTAARSYTRAASLWAFAKQLQSVSAWPLASPSECRSA